jgi:hypothetical protein
MKNKVDLFLDSGAFSAWSQGHEINIQEYIAFIKENGSCINVYSNLDVIGNPTETWKNQMVMEQAGLSPLPVFHYGEDKKWLKRIINKGYAYISLGGMVPISTKDLVPWLDSLWGDYLTDSSGMPICKVHGFGMTSYSLMLRYPWYSVDSTSWVVTGRMGGIYVPHYRNGEWIYDENSLKISVSSKSPDKKEAGKHISTMSPGHSKMIINYIEEKGYKLGVSEFKKEKQDYVLKENEKWGEKKLANKTDLREVEIIVEKGLSNMYQLRDEFNIMFFLDFEKSLPKWPWAFTQKNRQKKLFV